MRRGAPKGTYCGIPLGVWRKWVRSYQRSCWWLLFLSDHPLSDASALHYSVCMSALALLSPQWHRAHPGRLSEQHHTARRAWLELWRPLRKPDTASGQR